ncbi:MAG: hypothetical protein Q7S45_03050 [Candidatus Curtissbacteria bacterium]|nr:hypothetical protein [Candidatus Curtissbacteria bacterium]
MQKISAFKIKINDKTLDYRQSAKLDLQKAREFFESKYKVRRIWAGGRHVLGELEKSGQVLFLKLATTEGISEVTKIEKDWNSAFNKQVERRKSGFWVPQNFDSGIWQSKLFYLITDNFEGELLVQRPKAGETSDVLVNSLREIIDFSEFIGELKFENLTEIFYGDQDYKARFVNKTKSWFENVPVDIRNEYGLEGLLRIVADGVDKLEMRPRHGDFTPWHLFKLKTGQLGLIDGEHAMAGGVEGYDIGYFIQRVFSVVQNPPLAQKIFSMLLAKGYKVEKLKVIFAARAIGGFLDESLISSPDFSYANKFKDWIMEI